MHDCAARLADLRDSAYAEKSSDCSGIKPPALIRDCDIAL
jgi:hypothetical protein